MKQKNLFIIIIVAIISCSPLVATAQSSEVKINVAAGAATIFNPSLETMFGKSSAMTFDYVGAFAEENFMNTGYPFIFSMGVFGYRHYFEDYTHKGFFISGDFGLDAFRMNKNIIPLVASDHSDDGYDVGYGYLIGTTVGYKYPLSKNFNIEASISGGWHFARHEGYTATGERLFRLNASGEWTPYKAGIYLTYLFGPKLSR